MDQAMKVRENKARRAAERRGWKLERSRKRDPHALGFGMYMLLDAAGKPLPITSEVFLPDLPHSATLEQIEAALGITHTSR